MAEIKNNFFQGKMNKDLDERLVPNGQYRDALNIEVSTSEGDDIGTVQSVKGNTLVSGNIVPSGSSIVGEIADEKNNCIYYFVAGPHTDPSGFSSSNTQPTISKDLILKYDGSSITNVFTDVYSYLAVFDTSSTDISLSTTAKTITVPNTTAYKENIIKNMYVNVFDTNGVEYVRNNRIISIDGAVLTLENEIDDLQGVSISNLILHITHEDNKRPLNFNSQYPVTGVNIIEDFLIWTDNNSEPKKISISRSTSGTLTGSDGRNKSTTLFIDGSSNYPLTNGKVVDETHTTVIRKSPISSPIINIKQQRENVLNRVTDSISMSGVAAEDIIEVSMPSGETNPFLVNDILHLKASPNIPSETAFDVRLKVISLIGESAFKAKVFYNSSTSSSSIFNIFLVQQNKKVFEDKFSFFATRFKYIDGEYSTFSPFTQAAFLPNNFTYDTEEAFNKGMVNLLKELELTNIVPDDIPEDVVQVDILYTESNSPEIYKVDSVRKDSTNDTYWDDDKYVISEENIYSLIEEKQLLRQWDNVPKKALAQEIIGNRLVYGNYEQNYDLDNQNIELEAYVDNRVFTGAEILPNRHLSENFNNYTTTPIPTLNSPKSFTHVKSVNNKLAGFVSVNGTIVGSQFDKLHTSVSLNLESDAEYYYSFKISNWSGTGVLEGPALMSGNNITGKYGDFAKQVTGNGYYYGVMSIDIDRSSAVSVYNSSAIRDFMFQIKTEGFTCDISHFSLKKIINNNKESVKSLRNYKLGVVYADEYGRETPVLTGKSASLSVSKLNSNSINCIKSTITSDPPSWATHFKYFVKETSSDYNNIALDRIYKSGDGGYYLSFPSSERNKIDEDTFLILKKSHDDSVAVTDEGAIYKVLDVSNNAPDFIKTNRNSVGVGGVNADINTELFVDPSGVPLIAQNVISFKKDAWVITEGNPNLLDVITAKDLVFRFKNSANRASEIYRVESLELVDFNGNDHYRVTTENSFLVDDISFILNGSTIATDITIEFFTSKTENKPEFDSRFFVKVNQDSFITEHVYNNSTNSVLDAIIANVNSFYKNSGIQNFFTDYDTPFFGGGPASENSYAGGAQSTNSIAIHNLSPTIGSFNDLADAAFLTYNSTGPFSTNFLANDTLYYEARLWFESGHNSGTAAGSNGKNLYATLPEGLAFYILNIDISQNNLAKASIAGASGISDNVLGVDQTSVITSSGTTPGRIKHAAFSYSYGLFQSQDTSGPIRDFSVYGSQGAYMKFIRLFKFGLGNNDLGLTAEYGSNWFIDRTSYIGIQNDTGYDPETQAKYHMYHRAVHYETLSSSNVLEMAKNDGTSFSSAPAQSTNGKNDYVRVGRGIYTANQDDVDADLHLYGTAFHEVGAHYVQISYGGIEEDIPHGSLDVNDLTTVISKLQELGWKSTSASFQNFTRAVKIGAKFKFLEDPNGNEFTIQDFKVVKRYNHTPFPANSFTHHQVRETDGTMTNVTWLDLRTPTPASSTTPGFLFRARRDHNSTNNFTLNGVGSGIRSSLGKSVILQDSILDEEKRFLRGSNRRLTYIIKIDKLPDASSFMPVNSQASSADSSLMDGVNSKPIEFIGSVANEETQLTTNNPAVFETEPKQTEGLDVYYEASDFYDIKDHGVTQNLKYFNCYSFENGVESNRIKDVFNKPSVGKGIVASTTLEEPYKQDSRGSGLIFSGIYNSTSNVNNLNQFIQAEKITKDVNPTYGTIQKIYTRDSNLLVLCEDKILKILANKDAVFNADGNPQLTANRNVLGQTIPYVGEFGISKDPRSFAAQSHRVYFTDKQRGAVLRLSMDGLTTISQYGMSDFFKDELPEATSLIGSYDMRKNEYNLKIDGTTDYVISYNENVKGWTSFKSFTDMQAGISFNNNYYTFKDAALYKHHANNNRCTFYGDTFKSGNSLEAYVELIFNSDPYTNKRFKNLIYEGTQGKVDLLDVVSSSSDADFYNIEAKAGWFAETIITPTESGSVNEFLEKDSKWYNYIKGDTVTASNIDTSSFSVQGLSIISSNTVSS